ncbi:hypothetical protein [Bacillus sp. FSL K6-2971]|uniref:hypothetical protein n=1 Tax=Bacillus sp. FSL K6-2971 TaxID=2921487 RepID=UPI0030F546AC
MTEEKRTIHVLKDEKLGVEREYVAVDRNAEVGEKIVIVEKSGSQDPYNEGDIFTVDALSESDDCVRSAEAISDFSHKGTIFHTEYHVLEPTDIIHIDGERYRLEDRKAEAGEEVIAKNVDGKWPKLVSEVLIRLRYSVIINGRIINGKKATFIDHGFYYVLTPVQDDPEPKESDVITVLANLGAEVAELKRKNEQFEKALGWNEMGPGYIPEIRNGLSELKSVVSNYESEIGRMQAEINALHEDKVRLGEQLAKVTADDPRALSFTADEFAQIIVSLSRAGL